MTENEYSTIGNYELALDDWTINTRVVRFVNAHAERYSAGALAFAKSLARWRPAGGVYLLLDERAGLLKVGASSVPHKRILNHRRHGRVLRLLAVIPDNGALETLLHRTLQRFAVRVGMEKEWFLWNTEVRSCVIATVHGYFR